MGAWVEIAPRVIVPRVDPQPDKADKADKADKDLPEVSYGTWVRSSYDLLDGVDVSDDPDTLPGELVDELFPPKKDSP